MPLDIIRNDITKVRADAIVNTANPHVAIGTGTDQAIYEAAGAEQLLAARAKIGEIQPGLAAYTPAFNLNADYIIHTVGPEWHGGDCLERETVAQCYRNSLLIAEDLGCESIAFPLISTGTYGFPKDEALRIAVSEIRSFLFSHDMTVTLVVYDSEAFVISTKAFARVRSYIEEHDVKPPASHRRVFNRRNTGAFEPIESEKSVFSESLDESPYFDDWAEDTGTAQRKDSASRMAPDSALPEDAVYRRGAPQHSQKEKAYRTEAPVPEAVPKALPKAKKSARRSVLGGFSLDDILKRRGETFQQVLLRTIDRKGMTDPEVYKRSNIDRKLFSKIRSDVNYNPSKRTVMALIIGLRLNMDEATDLLQKAGYSFSPSSVSDLTVRYCIEQQIYDIHEINCYLFTFGEKTLGA